MSSEQREAIDEIVTKMRVGRMTRRTFIERAAVLGFTSAATISLLEACGGSSGGSSGGPATIVWQSENDTTDTYKKIAQQFNDTVGKEKQIVVNWKQGPSKTEDILTIYNNTLRARSSNIDVLSIDVVYPAQFASSSWLKEITSDQWPTSEQSKYLPGPIKACTYEGKIYAAPLRTDIGLLYYRSDLIKSAPKTWDELEEAAKDTSPSKTKIGYAWQGAQYEGLVCNFVEVLHGFGGFVLDPNDATKVTVNSPEAKQALEAMVGWIGSITPTAVTTYQEEQVRSIWQEGNASFMRNWPYAIALGNDTKQSKVAEKFAISPLPYGGSSTKGHSAIGGWNLGINNYSRNADAAWEFVKYTLGPEAQKTAALGASWTVTLQSIYDDQEVLQKLPDFAKFKPILQDALPRPVSAKYTTVSEAIQRSVYSALRKQSSPDEALSTLNSELQKIVTS